MGNILEQSKERDKEMEGRFRTFEIQFEEESSVEALGIEQWVIST